GGACPRPGDPPDADEFEFRGAETDGPRVLKVRIEPKPPAESPPPPAASAWPFTDCHASSCTACREVHQSGRHRSTLPFSPHAPPPPIPLRGLLTTGSTASLYLA